MWGGKGAIEVLLTLVENGFLTNGQDATELAAGIRDALKDRTSVNSTSVKVQGVGSVEH